MNISGYEIPETYITWLTDRGLTAQDNIRLLHMLLSIKTDRLLAYNASSPEGLTVRLIQELKKTKVHDSTSS